MADAIKSEPSSYETGPLKFRSVKTHLRHDESYFTLSTIALKASGLFIARSARTLRLISIPALWMRPINFE